VLVRVGTTIDRLRGFSLIELMVVISIVGLLSAIAVPAYYRYLVTARISAVTELVDHLVSQSILYSQTHGKFGSAMDLGYGTVTSNTIDNPTALTPYSAGYMTIDDYSGSTQCGRLGSFYANLDVNALGMPLSMADASTGISVECDWWNNGGIIHKSCYYAYGTVSGGSGTDNLLPGSTWFNANTTNGWDNNNTNTYEYSTSSYINSTCQ